MITFSNGHACEYMVASGALAFDGKGYPWERPLVWAGLVRPELFTVVIKTLTREPRHGNLRWWKPWDCVRLIPGGSVNKVGLTNPGIVWWCREVGLHLNFSTLSIAGSIFGDKEELLEMARMLNRFDLVALEVNVSCPNTGHAMEMAERVVESVKAVKQISRHPIIVKVSVDQDYSAIARGLVGIAEAISLNSVPWAVFGGSKRSPLWRLECRVGGGGGGVSGKPAQKYNWLAVETLAREGSLPVIAPSIMEFEDMAPRSSRAVSFGAIHLRTPWRPTLFVKRERK